MESPHEPACRKRPTRKPDIVVLDISLRYESGLTLLAELNQATAPPIIILTAFSRAGLRDYCQQAGARYFFDKTSEIDAFIQTLRDLAAHPSIISMAAGVTVSSDCVGPDSTLSVVSECVMGYQKAFRTAATPAKVSPSI